MAFESHLTGGCSVLPVGPAVCHFMWPQEAPQPECTGAFTQNPDPPSPSDQAGRARLHLCAPNIVGGLSGGQGFSRYSLGKHILGEIESFTSLFLSMS